MNPKYILLAGAAAFCFGMFNVSANEIANKTCSLCHGADGNSVNPAWPNLAGQHPEYVIQQLQAFKTDLRKNPNMAPIVQNLSDDDFSALAEYYAGQQPKIGVIKSEEIAAGETLYRGGDKEKGIPACMACHGPNGAGNRAANYPALRGQHAEYTSLQLAAYRSGERTTDADRKAMMQSIAAKMSDEDIKNVAKYINALH